MQKESKLQFTGIHVNRANSIYRYICIQTNKFCVYFVHTKWRYKICSFGKQIFYNANKIF